MPRRILDTMIVSAGWVIPFDVVILSSSMTPNGRIHLVVERDEELGEARGDEVYSDADIDLAFIDDEAAIDAVLDAMGLIYERSEEE